MKKFKQWTRRNYHWAALAAFVLLLLVFYQFVFMYSDDFRYGQAGKGDFRQIAEFMGEHYRTVNGRTLVHTFAVLFTKHKLFFWRLVTPAALGALMVLIAKFSAKNAGDFKKGIVLSCALYLLLPVGMLQQSIYWLAGSFNYLYPLLPILLLGMLMKRSIARGRANYWLLPLGAASGATMEQCGMIALGICVLTMLHQRVFEKKKLLPVHYFTVSAVLAGYITIFLSPATRERVAGESGHIRLLHNSYRILIEKWFTAWEVYPIVVLSTLCVLFWLIYSIKNRTAARSVSLVCAAVLLLGLPVIGAFAYAPNLPLPETLVKLIAGAFGAFWYFGIAWAGLICLRKTKNENIMIGIILALGSQLMLIAAAYTGFRNGFPTVIFLFPFYIHTALQFRESLKGKAVFNAACAVAAACVLLNTGTIFYGYCTNAVVYRENLRRIEAYRSDPQGALVLKSYPHKNYRWYLPCDDPSGGQGIGFKQYHDLSQQTEIIFE